MKGFVAIFVLCLCLGAGSAQKGQCKKKTPCSCEFEDGTIVDLSPLVNNSISPVFANVSDSSGDLYSWNPCVPFTYPANHSECFDVAVCLIRPGGIPQEIVYSLGDQDSAEFTVDTDNNLFLTYSNPVDDFVRSAKIQLLCSEFQFIQPKGEQGSSNEYDIVFASPHACAKIPIVPATNTSAQCTKLTPCSCQYPDGSIVDLSPLANSDGSPKYANYSDDSNDLYSWNPCVPFTYAANHSECFDVAVCLIRNGFPRELVYNLGDQSSASFSVDENNNLFLTYTAKNEGFNRSARIQLICSDFEFVVPKGEVGKTNEYNIAFSSSYACARYIVNPGTTDDDSLSGGYVFLIILVSLVGAYLIFGMAYQKIVKGESGIKIIPNNELWCNTLPGLVKSGCKCEACRQGEKRYDSI